MGQFKNYGEPSLALAEECAEVIQVITKLHRFGGNWDEVAPGKDLSRWEELKGEMEDLLFQWERLKQYRSNEEYDRQWECEQGVLHDEGNPCTCPDGWDEEYERNAYYEMLEKYNNGLGPTIFGPEP